MPHRHAQDGKLESALCCGRIFAGERGQVQRMKPLSLLKFCVTFSFNFSFVGISSTTTIIFGIQQVKKCDLAF